MRRLRLRLLLVAAAALLVLASAARRQHDGEEERVGRVLPSLDGDAASFLRVIVVGATGDLAAKYLWAACFRLALEARLTQRRRVLFVAAARDAQTDGERWRKRFFSPQWAARVCGDDRDASGGSTESEETCRQFYENEFEPSVEYATVEQPRDYAALASALRANDRADSHGVEVGRLVYLAIPPQVFLSASRSLSQHLRPPSPSAFFRVVIEKPFGRDLASAAALASSLREVLSDDEMLLMDHYAGKPGIRVIDPFVRRNAATLARIWNGNAIDKIAITMSETETCEHRLDYFDRNGIIRDVMANHLQLLLGVVVAPSLRHCRTTDSSDDLGDLCPHELTTFLRSLSPTGQLVVGQYEAYNAQHLDANRSVTATAAFAQVTSSDAAWADTRITISAAKATNVRRADVLVTFAVQEDVHDHGAPCTVRFVVQDGPLSRGERIDVKCASLGELNVPASWKLDKAGGFVPSPRETFERSRRFAWQLGDPISAYDSLLHDAAHGRCDNFMKIDEVLASWQLWSPIVLAAELLTPASIVTYPVGSPSWMLVDGLLPWCDVHGDRTRRGVCAVTTLWARGSRRRRDAAGRDPAARGT